MNRKSFFQKLFFGAAITPVVIAKSDENIPVKIELKLDPKELENALKDVVIQTLKEQSRVGGLLYEEITRRSRLIN